MNQRINFLDGLRGLAILLVIFYHAYTRWSLVLPYGDRFASFVVFKYGFLGVQLFFLISGFVILMSLEKSDNFFKFIYKRWLRLFPTMLIATVLVFVTASCFPERPAGIPTLKNVISGLIFVQPEYLESIIGTDVGILEPAFWSLFVEVKFYAFFGILYFILGARKALLCLTGAYFIWFAMSILLWEFDYDYVVIEYLNFLDASFFGWFASGAMAFLYYKSKSKIDLLCSIIIGGIASLVYYEKTNDMTFMFLLLGVFISTIHFEKLKKIFADKIFLFFGFISYPLYLIHENAMVSIIIKGDKYLSFLPHFLLPIIAIAILAGVAYLIAKTIEPFVRKLIDNNLQLLFSKIRFW